MKLKLMISAARQDKMTHYVGLKLMVSMVSAKRKQSSDTLDAQCFSNEMFPSLSKHLFCMVIRGISFYYVKIEL